MAKILCVTRGLPSIVYPSLELARRLAVDGHRVVFAGEIQFRPQVEHLGLEFLPLEPSEFGDFAAHDRRSRFLHRLVALSPRRARATKALAEEDFLQTIQGLDLDLALVDGEMHEHIFATIGAKIPTVLLNSFSSIWRRPGLPPAHAAVRPGVGFRGSRLGMLLLWWVLDLRKMFRSASLALRHAGCDRRSILRLLARESGLHWRRDIDTRQWLMPFTYRRQPVLSLHALEFEFPHHPPNHVTYVGPMPLEQRIDRPLPVEDRERLDGILERHNQVSEHRLIYAAFGSTLSTDQDFLHRLVDVVDERPHWELILSLSGRGESTELGHLPDQVHVFDWIPQPELLPHVDAMVTHGGINTLDECVLHGVPMLIYCGFETDMGGNTARVLHHGLGLAGDRRQDTTSIIRGHLDRLLQEPDFGHRLERMAESYRAYAQDRVAERAVSSLLGSWDGGSQ